HVHESGPFLAMEFVGVRCNSLYRGFILMMSIVAYGLNRVRVKPGCVFATDGSDMVEVNNVFHLVVVLHQRDDGAQGIAEERVKMVKVDVSLFINVYITNDIRVDRMFDCM